METGWNVDTPVDDNLIRQFLTSQATVDAIYARAGGGRAEAHDDIHLADSGGPVPFINQSILRRPLTGVDDDVLDRAAAFAPDDRPSVLLSAWPTPDLTTRGWMLLGHPGLVVRPPAPVPDDGIWATAPGVEVVEADSPAAVAVAERIFVDGYPVPWAKGAPPGTALPPGIVDEGLRVRIANVDGEPVAVGQGFVGHGLVNLCGGAALPAARRRGAWKALVRVRVADDPSLPAMAYTSDDSRPGFIALGFLVICRFTLWGRHFAT